jgi:hypothetical protein
LGKEEDTTVGAIHGKNFFDQSGKESITRLICSGIFVLVPTNGVFFRALLRWAFDDTTPVVPNIKVYAPRFGNLPAVRGWPELSLWRFFSFEEASALAALSVALAR